MTVKEKVEEAKDVVSSPKNKKYIMCLAYLLSGFAFGFGSVLKELHPFGVSIVAVSKKRYIPFSLFGAAAGTLVGGINAYSLRYIAALLTAALFSLGIYALDLSAVPTAPMGAAFLSVLVTGAVLNLNLGENAAAYLLVLGESILSAGAAYFFYRTLHADYRRLRFRALPLSDISCIVIFFTLTVMNLSSLKLGVFTPARIISAAVMLSVLRFTGDRRGIIIALCLSFSLSLSDSENLFLTGAFAFSILTASLFSGLSVWASGVAFLLANAFFCIASSAHDAFGIFIDCAVGTGLAMLLPHRLTKKIEKLCESSTDAPPDGSLRQSLVLKLRFAGAAMAAISESVEQVSDKIDEITRKENDALKEQISEEEYASREIIHEKTNRIRRVASDQFFSISGMLDDLAFEFDNAEIFNSSASVKIRRLLGEYEIFPQSVCAVEDKYSRMRVEILLDSYSPKLENERLKKEIGKICSRYFEDAKITNFKEETMLSFNERANYRLSFGFSQHSAEGHLCGDTVKVINDSRGHSLLIISDGMGKGSRAALDGAMGAGLLSKLINAGFGFDSALKVVNCALLVKSNDESLATLDIANIDLFTGKCEMLKAGAPASYIVKGDSITKCELFSMPAGILRGIEFAKRTAVLSLNDSVILMSDGISELGEEWLNGTLREHLDKPPQEAAESIIKSALENSGDKIDDMSIIVARLERN